MLLAAVADLASVGYVLVQASASRGATQDLLAGLGVLGVVRSWFVVHTLFALRYGRLHYAGHPGGVDFNQPSPPRYLDFAYLSFPIGMTFQVSDTPLTTPALRATALRQSLIAYLVGAVILAAMINLVSQLATKSRGPADAVGADVVGQVRHRFGRTVSLLEGGDGRRCYRRASRSGHPGVQLMQVPGVKA